MTKRTRESKGEVRIYTRRETGRKRNLNNLRKHKKQTQICKNMSQVISIWKNN